MFNMYSLFLFNDILREMFLFVSVLVTEIIYNKNKLVFYCLGYLVLNSLRTNSVWPHVK